MRICPKDVTDKIFFDNVDIETAAQLEARLENNRAGHRELDIIHGCGDAMDLSAVDKGRVKELEKK